jgi:hypothetical protein
MARTINDYTPPPTPARTVDQFPTYDLAMRDARLRGACIVLDAHFRFWSTPVELTILEVHSQIFRQLCDELAAPPEPLAVVISPPASFGNPAA